MSEKEEKGIRWTHALLRALSIRGAGHTHAMLKGAEQTPNAKVVTMRSTQRLDLPRGQEVWIEDLERVSMGNKFPVLVDNFVLETTLRGLLGAIRDRDERIKELETVVAESI